MVQEWTKPSALTRRGLLRSSTNAAGALAFAPFMSPNGLLIASAVCFLVFLLAVQSDPSGFSQIMGLAWPLLLIAAGVVWVVNRRRRDDRPAPRD